MSERSATDSTSLQGHIVALTRAFGWHRPGSTPCGQPVPIAEAHALLELSRTPGLTQQGLAGLLNLRKSTVSGIVAKLEGRGWVQRRRSAEDRRAMEVSLTEQGVRIAAELATAREVKMEGVLKNIPEEQRAVVMQALQTLIEAIHEHEA